MGAAKVAVASAAALLVRLGLVAYGSWQDTNSTIYNRPYQSSCCAILLFDDSLTLTDVFSCFQLQWWLNIRTSTMKSFTMARDSSSRAVLRMNVPHIDTHLFWPPCCYPIYGSKAKCLERFYS